MRTVSRKLDQLTSLRFIAALMIVVHHSAGLFGTGETRGNFGQGVSFFFVLSGFILTYVYPSLSGGEAVRRFWRARVARIWPAHAAALVLGAVLVGYTRWDPATFIANVTMTQSWVPWSTFYFSYNAVSWSISTEFFFYLAFPLLIFRWERTWWWKLPLVLGLLLALFAYSNGARLPVYGDPMQGQGMWVAQHGVVYIHPVARLFEFTAGMCIALAWRRSKDADIGTGLGTLLEVVAVLACAASMAYMTPIAALGGRTFIGDAGRLWLTYSGSMFSFGGLILVTALGRGWVSRALALPGVVLLGEISYSMYLVHHLLLRYYRAHRVDFAGMPDVVAGSLFMAILLLLSYLMWSLVEMPGRRLLVGGGTVHGTGVLAQSWTDKLALHRRALIAGVVMVALVVVAHVGWRTPAAPAPAPVAPAPQPAVITPPVAPGEYTGTRFGDDATLQGLELRCTPDALELRAAWSSGNGTAGALINAVHVLDDAGAILTQFDHPQPAPTDAVRGGAPWNDQVRMAYSRLRGTGASRIALGVYDEASGLRKIDRGMRDWGDRRLVIPLPPCARAALRANATNAATP